VSLPSAASAQDLTFLRDGSEVVVVTATPAPASIRWLRVDALSISDFEVDGRTFPPAVRRVAALADGTLVILGYSVEGPDFSRGRGRLPTKLGWSPVALLDLSIDSPGRRIAVLGEDEQVRVGELIEGELVEVWHTRVPGPRGDPLSGVVHFLAAL
jgi:hypothetical protein